MIHVIDALGVEWFEAKAVYFLATFTDHGYFCGSAAGYSEVPARVYSTSVEALAPRLWAQQQKMALDYPSNAWRNSDLSSRRIPSAP